MTRLSRGLMPACRWLTRLMALNLLWLGFAAVGAIVLGVMPATAAVFTLLGPDASRPEESMVARFWAAYRREFWRANLFGYLLVGLGYLIAMNLAASWNARGLLNIVAAVVFLTLALAYCLTALYAFPTLVQVRTTAPRTFALAFAAGLSRPLVTMGGLLGCGLALIAMVRWAPFLLVFLGVALPAAIMSWAARLVQQRRSDPLRRSHRRQEGRVRGQAGRGLHSHVEYDHDARRV